ncbi:TIGR01244 family sulfur transferase [Pseudomonas guariconensis]|uniref:TIGR01244 family sulfur transferase n=1 Tax=Pseudomonas guariconensis TaxID=1288410 RepID=UPI0018A8AB27|nr:TIGR01244 family sulfur transferase [Pseudomonas guariconensis]MBF8741903.1 TIGR01244 family phosphatase [Pseudomonas guariconensis]MBF8750877.1 TIGR01244 family phosphatase [Pseudomonas guariconensis]
MTPRFLDEYLSVAAQLSPEDLAPLASAGFRHIICNRPDDENDGQPSHQCMAEAAVNLGMVFVYQPIRSADEIVDAHVRSFADTLDSAAGPTIAYCRTGTRSATLWAMSQAARLTIHEVKARLSSAGFDTDSFFQRIDHCWKVSAT